MSDIVAFLDHDHSVSLAVAAVLSVLGVAAAVATVCGAWNVFVAIGLCGAWLAHHRGSRLSRASRAVQIYSHIPWHTWVSMRVNRVITMATVVWMTVLMSGVVQEWWTFAQLVPLWITAHEVGRARF